MARWRDIKHQKNIEKEEEITSFDYSQNAGFLPRFKALVVDMFMIYMPLLYIITYLIIGDAQSFRGSELAPFSAILIYGIISTIMVYKTGQTIGKKAYEIKIVDAKTGENLSLLKSFLRFFLFLFSSAFILGIVLSFFRDDKRTLHDLLIDSVVIEHKS
jgi:uncharacterized RDD family membrane protein YckC